MEELKTFKELAVDWESGRLMREGGELVYAYGIDGLRLWIERALRRENKRLFYEGLGKNYGHELHRLIGRNLGEECVGLVLAAVQECLCANPYIKSVSLTGYTVTGSTLAMTLDITTVYDRMEITEVIEL